MTRRGMPNRTIERKTVHAASRITFALFDFDHTVTDTDTFIDFTVFAFGRVRVALWMLAHFPSVAAAMTGLSDINRIKKIFFARFFRGYPEREYLTMCERYANERLPRFLRPAALDRIAWHVRRGDAVVVISASLDGWIAPWARTAGVRDIIATFPGIENGRLTGKFTTPNCNGREKVRRFTEKYPDREKYVIYAYGDSSGDRAMLAFADHAYYRSFE